MLCKCKSMVMISDFFFMGMVGLNLSILFLS